MNRKRYHNVALNPAVYRALCRVADKLGIAPKPYLEYVIRQLEADMKAGRQPPKPKGASSN